MDSEKLIQIIGYRAALNKETGKPYLYQKHFKEIKISSIVNLFKNLDAIISAIPVGELVNVHYTNANCHSLKEDKSVPLRLFAYQEMVPIDLDGIDLHREKEYTRIIKEVCEIDLSKTGIFCSGNGLHFVIALTQPITSGEELHRLQKYYVALMGKINIAIFEAGLSGHADPVRFAEAATLRLPKTLNRKEGKPDVMSSVIQGNVDPQPFYLDRLVDIVEEELIKKSLLVIDTKAVLAGCCFLKHCLNNPKMISEPQWYSMLGINAFIPEIGINLCHTYSKEHPDYSFEVTQQKAEQALGFGKPRTCDSVSQVYAGCAQCPFNGKVKTPLSIKGDDFIRTEHSGFHDIIENTNGSKKAIPNYDDLLKYFIKRNLFITNNVTKQVHIFNGTHWEMYETAQLEGFATSNFTPTAKNNMRAEFVGIVKSTNLMSGDFFGKDNAGFINFKNGVLRLADDNLLPHSPDFGFTYVLPYDYNPHAACPEFDKMLDNVTLKDEELKNVLLEFIGYAISGIKASHGAKALILTGEGSNGKSTLLNVIKRLVGKDCFSSVSLEDMGNPNCRYSMVGKLFNICEEIEEKELKKGTATFKTVVTGGEMMVKKLYSDSCSMRLDAKLIISCNELPSSRENTYAIYRRMLIIPFRARFDKATGIDKSIENRIAVEMSGVYNRVLKAYKRFMENNGVFSDSKIADKVLEEYKYNNSSYNQFADTHLIRGTLSDFMSNDELITMYNSWANINNVNYKPTSTQLIKELKIIGILAGDSAIKRIGNTTKRGYTGVKRIEEQEF